MMPLVNGLLLVLSKMALMDAGQLVSRVCVRGGGELDVGDVCGGYEGQTGEGGGGVRGMGGGG